jgi:hypothetical protein
MRPSLLHEVVFGVGKRYQLLTGKFTVTFLNPASTFIHKIARAWRKGRFLERCRRALVVRRNRLLYGISPVLLAEVRFRSARGGWPDLKDPKTFDEKLLWLMLFWCDPLKTRCADKVEIRGYAQQLGLGHLLPQLLGVYHRSDDIHFDALPGAFALKAAHGSGMNIICRDKRRLDLQQARWKLNLWLKTDYSTKYGEIHYRPMKRRIICESLLTDDHGGIPIDYKLYCFAGKVHCTLVCTGRDPMEDLNSGVKFDFYNSDWTQKLPYSRSSLRADRKIPKPAGYEEMVSAAELLSKPFPFVRVDFYSINGRALLGEMTFAPEAGIDLDNTELADNVLGGLIQLPPKT